MERSLLTTLLVVLVATVTVSLIATGVTQAQAPGPVTSPPQLPAWDEAEAQSIDRSIMCPVCPAETIDQAQVPIARQMRQLVREKLAAGESRGEILKYFAERYGQDIVAFPPKSGLNLVAWVFPVVSVALLLAGGGLVLRAMASRRGVPDPAPVPADGTLEPYLARVDEELARLQIYPQHDAGSGDAPQDRDTGGSG